MKHLTSAIVFSAALLAGGCASTGYDKAGDTSDSLQKASRAIAKSDVQIDKTLLSLSDLVNNPNANLESQFKRFSSEVSKLESLENEVIKNSETMQKEGAAYFQKWDLEVAKIHNEKIRSRSTERKNTVAHHFDNVRVSYVQAQSDFKPFMSDLKDIRTALSADLTVGGINAVRTVAGKAHEEAFPLKTTLHSLSGDFKALGISLSSASGQN